MLNDRDYMYSRNNGPDEGSANGGRQAVWGLIIANLVCYFLFGYDRRFALSPAGVRSGDYFQIVSAMFMHIDFFHLFFNMFSLYIFGMLAAPILGARRFLILYFTAGIAGNVLWLASGWSSAVPLLGASGAVMGVIIASAMLMPNVDMFILFIPFPVKLRTMAVVFILIELFRQLTNRDGSSGIAYLAHIGGFIGGYLVMRFFYRRFVRWDPLGFLGGAGKTGQGGYSRRPQPPPGWTVRGDDRYAPPPPPPSGRVTQQELDMLLDKISAGGINSLSEDELNRLRQAREQMRGGK